MIIVMGATGHVGQAVARALLRRGQAVTALTRNPARAAELEREGARVAVADVHDAEALRQVFRQGRRLFLLNPPAPPSTDTDVEERRTIATIVEALRDSGLERVVAESTYGAQRGRRIGDLGTLFELEEALALQSIPSTVIRAAYYMSNWDASLEPARDDGRIETPLPPDFPLPMVAPDDIGEEAARLLLREPMEEGVHYIEGPARCRPNDVAAAFAAALKRPVQAAAIPRAHWPMALKAMGFSAAAAQSFIAMTELTLRATFPAERDVTRGRTSIEAYVERLVASAAA